MKIYIFGILLVIMNYSECANILYVVPFTSRSHTIMLKPIGLELARKGHNVTVITGYLEKTDLPNYHQIKIDHKEIWEILGTERPNVFTMTEISAEEFHDLIFWRGGLAFTEMALNSSQVRQFLAKDNKFDLVISEQFFQEAMYTLALKYRAPLALVTTFGNCMRHNIATRNPLQLATVIPEFLDLNEPTSFWARLRNFYFTFYEFAWWRYWYLVEQEHLAKKYIPGLPDKMPSLYDIQKNVSLFLINSHFSFDSAVAYLPNIVEIGGVHLSHSIEKLPQDLQTLLDKATDGVIYVNFGSNVRSSELPVDKMNAFLKIFSEINQTILWKWEDDKSEIKSKNIVFRKWFPQKEILSHPNIKVFISHGGLIGTQEAIFHGVPIIGVPIYADQYNNLLQAEKLGFGKILRFEDINEQSLRNKLIDVLSNNSYRIKAKEVSSRFKDRPMNPLDTAVFWIEYVIRHNGADFMKNPAIQLSWLSYNMFDVYAFVLGVTILLLYVIIRLILYIRQYFRINVHKNDTVKNKKKL
ncbi:unnamed protein product [Diatraea saccharalis]|uniref:UDP-glucuronosyltransferase n=1 Tax=Diatraea saccharalis TaxID=40085 RepID=A0A9N9QZT0_9NEOP|nr:unnamed protein product [Diatraea saccharalis]